jgi:hypothetical protein
MELQTAAGDQDKNKKASPYRQVCRQRPDSEAPITAYRKQP